MMNLALKEAKKALAKDEVPVGAIITLDGIVVARAHNLTQTKRLPTAHAEILCIEKAAKKLGNFRLVGCEIFITTEPCLMCLGAILESRIKAVYFGCHQEKMGAISRHNLNPNIPIVGGVLEQECAALLQNFFQGKR